MTTEVFQYIKKHFSYNPLTGVIVRDDRKGSNGSYDKDGYLILKIKKHQYKAHRIAWLLYYGKEPSSMLDHINRCRSDNRISNLREANYLINNNNATHRINPDTGVYGVHITKMPNLNKKYSVKLNNQTKRFYTIEEAVAYRQQYIDKQIYGKESLPENP